MQKPSTGKRLSEAELLKRAKARKREQDNRRIDIINAHNRGKSFARNFAPINEVY